MRLERDPKEFYRSWHVFTEELPHPGTCQYERCRDTRVTLYSVKHTNLGSLNVCRACLEHLRATRLDGTGFLVGRPVLISSHFESNRKRH